jgi:Flp pilus assembly protein TadG
MLSAPSRYAKTFGADCRGNLMIEFALALPILFMLLVGLVDLGRFSLQKSAMLQGAREGAQYGIIASTESANINTTAQNATGLTGITATNTVFCECVSGTSVLCTSTCTGGTSPRKYVRVTTSATFTSMLSSTTNAFGRYGSWNAPTSLSASVTLIVP